MKNLFKIFVLLFVVGVMSSCEPDEYDVPDIELVPVYSISETGNNTYTDIQVYKQENLLTIANKDGIVSAYSTSSYSDVSDETNYMFTVIASEKVTLTDEEGNETMGTVSYAYDVTADKETGSASITILKTAADGTESTISLNGTLTEDEVYN
nr:hypothetical protein [uncultured Marinifilum sp.]